MKIIKYIIGGIIPFLFFACNDNNQNREKVKQENDITEFAAHLVTEDTIKVRQLVTQFMEYAKEQRYEMAAAMLYKPHPENAWKEPQLLDNDELHGIANMLKRLPIHDYKIDYINFNSAIKNDVACTVTIRQADSSSPAMTNKIHFNPMNYLGGWRLCLMN